MQPSSNSIMQTGGEFGSLTARPGRPASLKTMQASPLTFANKPQLGTIAGGLIAMLAAVVVLFCSGCQTPPTGPVPKQWVAQTPGALGAGDVVKLSFPGAPELTQSQKIRADGKISLPMLGETTAAGKRLGQLQAELSRLYKPQLKNSEVVVALEFSAIPVYVSGAVNKPGKVTLERPMTVLEAIMEAGGFIPDVANPKKVVLIRNIGGQHTTHIFDLSPALRGKTTDAFLLKAYDVIYVQQGF